MMLNIVDVYKDIADRQKKRKEIFRIVMKQCEKHIRNVVQADGIKCIFVVPEFIWGMPLYNVTECTKHVKTELERAGFHVTFYFPRLLLVSWDMSDLDHSNAKMIGVEAATPDQELIDKRKKEVLKDAK
eukprot:gene19683-26370_t